MKKIVFVGFLFIFLAILGFLTNEFFLPALRPATGKLSINVAGKSAKVYLDGKFLGQSPLYRKNLRTGDHKIELKRDNPARSWQGNLNLTTGTLSTVDIDFGPSPTFFSGETLHFRTGSRGVSLITRPTDVEVVLNSKSQGKTPLFLDLGTGVQVVVFNRAGYLSRELSLNVEPGYKLSVNVDLAINPFQEVTKLEGGQKLSLFGISNTEVDLSDSFNEWVEAIKYFQEILTGVQNKFDLIVDENGKVYILDKTSWQNKLATKTAANIGYISKDPTKLSTPAAQEWLKLKQTFQ